jgi:predicted metallo-beta-lactamase superfamily hydrolase
LKIKPLAFDSFGTRSMSTFVETEDLKIIIDPGVALAPTRYSYPPHPLEVDRENEHWMEIVKHAKQSNVLIVTHYHYDHHDPNEEITIYDGKTVFIKHPTEKINFSQTNRARFFLSQIKGLPKQLEYSDGREFQFGNTKIKFSKPVFHGTNPRLGYVTEVLIDDGYRFIHTSDVEGPSVEDQVNFILQNKPNLVILDGPLSYMLGFRYSYESLNLSIENMLKIIDSCPLDSLIVDHHLLRDLEWKDRIRRVLEAGDKSGVKVQTAAEYAGKPVEMLEAHRKELYQEQQKKSRKR